MQHFGRVSFKWSREYTCIWSRSLEGVQLLWTASFHSQFRQYELSLFVFLKQYLISSDIHNAVRNNWYFYITWYRVTNVKTCVLDSFDWPIDFHKITVMIFSFQKCISVKSYTDDFRLVYKLGCAPSSVTWNSNYEVLNRHL